MGNKVKEDIAQETSNSKTEQHCKQFVWKINTYRNDKEQVVVAVCDTIKAWLHCLGVVERNHRQNEDWRYADKQCCKHGTNFGSVALASTNEHRLY